MTENKFSGSVPETYHCYLVPLIFTDYARDLAQRIASRPVQAVLETAAEELMVPGTTL